MQTFRQWLEIREETKPPSHSGMYKSVLNVGREAMVGMPISYSGQVGDKVYSMLPCTVLEFLPSPENPTHVRLQLNSSGGSQDPALAQQVVWAGKKDMKQAPADSGVITVSIQEFDKALGQGWAPAMMGQGGMMGGGIGL